MQVSRNLVNCWMGVICRMAECQKHGQTGNPVEDYKIIALEVTTALLQ